jgi:hypothetical protein
MTGQPGMSTQSYRPFAMVDVLHDYFADGRARHLQFRPQAETRAFLRRFGMLLRTDGNGFTIGVCEAQLPGIWSERTDEDAARVLRFDVHSADPASAYYTDAVTASWQVKDDEAQPAPLQAVPLAASAPLATIALPLDPTAGDDFDTWTAALGTRYRLRMHSRRTIWKYLLTGDWQGRKLSVVDQRGETAFTAPAPERMPDGQQALVVHSTTPIALQERPAQRFQLRDVTDSPERILIARLPGAKPQRLWREVVNGQPTAVSEIFVHS